MKISVNMDGINQTIAKVNRFQKKKQEAIKRVVSEYGHIIEGQAVALAPVAEIDGGNLKNSMTLKFENKDLTAEISNSAEYAADVEFGTRPHIIKPKPESGKKALFWGGARHPVKLVHHPGTRAQPFLFPAYDMNKRPYISAMRRAVREPEE